jgi:hypothetical protein
MPTFARVRRERGPALAWTPTQDSYYELAQRLRSEGRLPVYLTQAAILEFEAHLRESPLPLPFGLLAGDVCVCPRTRLEYLLADTVSRARVELGGDDPYAQLAEELQSLASEQSRQRKVPIGWYLGGLADDLTLDADVTRLHEQLFPERWQVVLVRGAASGAELGAFLRYESVWARWYSIPFFELLPERGGHKKGERRTAIRWENYRADEPALPLDESEAAVRDVNEAPRPSWAARLFGASASPLRAPEPPPAQPVERKIAVPAVDRVTAPIERKLTAPVESRVTAPAVPMRAAPIEKKLAAPAALRAAPTPKVKVAPTVASPTATPVAREEPEPVVQHVFIDGILVPAPLASELFQKPGMSPGSDRVSKSSVLGGALLLMMLVLLYFAAS